MEETEILKIELQWSYTLRPGACSNSQATALLMNQHGGGVQHCGYSLFPAPFLGQGCCLYSDCLLHVKPSPKQKGCFLCNIL